jgi:allantoin racemase
MRLLVANPNSTEAITESCAALARAAASPGTKIAPWTNRGGPPVVDSVYADYMAGRPLLRGLAELRPLPDAIVLAGFGNYGTAAVKEALDLPVVSMAEAAMALALPLCRRFAIVTTAPRMIAYTQDLVRLAGLDARCAAVHAVTLPPIGEAPPPEEAVLAELGARAEAMRARDGADLIILGGSRLSPYAAALRRAITLPVLEPVACAVHIAEALVRLDLRHGKSGAYAAPTLPLRDYGE